MALPPDRIEGIFVDDVWQVTFPNILDLLLQVLRDAYDSFDCAKSEVELHDRGLLHEYICQTLDTVDPF